MKAVTVETMRKMDETAIHTYGIPSTVLMEHAAMAVCGYFLAHIEKSKQFWSFVVQEIMAAMVLR